jgi:hypothetical protein
MSKSNEYYMLRRAARHLVVDLWTSDHFWTRQERIMEVDAAVKLLRQIADSLPKKESKRHLSWMSRRVRSGRG